MHYDLMGVPKGIYYYLTIFTSDIFIHRYLSFFFQFIGLEFILIDVLIKLLKVAHYVLEENSSVSGGVSWLKDFEEFIRVLEGKGIIFCDYNITFPWVV